ncbi:MAG: thrombospondin type 3 repeat-containing protein [Methanomicrobiales archaeon]|nr:thrombospondin type 3 repeat-containing protein [Methanomicrobiales archaeon]
MLIGIILIFIVSPVPGVTFTGSVYEGDLGDTSIPSSGVTVNLYGSNTYAVQGTWISQGMTNQSGFYSLEGPDTWEYNNIILEVPSGATSVGAQSVSGTVLSPTWILVPFSVVGGNLFLPGNDFWIERAVSCPEGCECLSVPAATEKYLTFERCSGDICGYDAPNVPRYCMRPVAVTTTPTGPVDGTPCDDRNFCTTDDTYQNGICVSGTPLVCDDQNPDTIDTCDPAQGCIFIAQTPKEADCTCILESEAKARFISYVRCNDTPCGSVPIPQNDPCLYCNMFPQYCNCTEDPGHCTCDQYTQFYFRKVPFVITTPRPGETVPLSALDSDKDGVPDINDNCPFVANPDQADSEVIQVGCMPSPRGGCTPIMQNGDGVGDACDNCPSVLNENQVNFNNDTWGDACDCWDVFQSSAESGVDCGGVCGPCLPLPPGWAHVTPIRLKGAINQGFIDIVFIPNTDYASDISAFRSDAINLIRNRFFTLQDATSTAIRPDYKDHFNFYLYEGGFGNRTDRWNLPTNFWVDAPGTDVAAILKNSGCCVGESWYFGPPAWLHCPAKNGGICIHEFGHAIFSLVDEYCGSPNYNCYNKKCPTSTNVWLSSSDCDKDATAQGWTNGTCRRIEHDDPNIPGVDCQMDFWRYDTGSCIMESAGSSFGDACSGRIAYTFDHWPSGSTKGILISFHVREGNFSLVSSQVVTGHPDLGLQENIFNGKAYSSQNELIATFGAWDPRIGFGDEAVVDEEGNVLNLAGYPAYRDDIDFPIIIPFYNNLKSFLLEDNTTGERLVEVDLTPTLHSYCESAGYEEPECRSLDLDGDGIRDYEDSDPLNPAAAPVPGFTFILGIGGLLLVYLIKRRTR